MSVRGITNYGKLLDVGDKDHYSTIDFWRETEAFGEGQRYCPPDRQVESPSRTDHLNRYESNKQ
jgi:hypothetical protein